MNFNVLVETALLSQQSLQEDSVAGGDGSAFGSAVSDTSTAFSGDNYASGDHRGMFGLYGGIITRQGIKKKKRKKRNKKTKKK